MCQHSWCEQYEILKAAPIQRHIRHVTLIDNRANRRIRRIDNRCARLNGHAFRQSAYHHIEIHRDIVRHMQRDAWLNDHLEPVLRHGKLVVARGKAGKPVDALLIRLDHGFNARVHIFGRNGRLDNDGPIRVHHPARHLSHVRLRKKCAIHPQQVQQDTHNEANHPGDSHESPYT